MSLPRPSPPQGGVAEIKRARTDPAGRSATLSGVPYPTGTNSIGVGDHMWTGRPTNGPHSWDFLAAPLADHPWTQNLKRHEIVFAFRDRHNTRRTPADSNRALILGLPQLHYRWHEHALKFPNESSPQAMLDKWFATGVLNASDVLPGLEHKERAVVVLSSADDQTFNLWGPVAEGAKHAWLVLQEVEVDKGTRYITAPNAGEIYTPGVLCADGKSTITHVPRLVPVLSDNQRCVAWKDRVYKVCGQERCGIPIYVGAIIENRKSDPSNTSPVDSVALTTDIDKLHRAGKISLYLSMGKDALHGSL